MTTATAERTQAATMRLTRLEVENFMRLKALTIDADGKSITISGPNGAGKTSAVNAIWAALQGKSVKELPEPIHHGEERAVVRLSLGHFEVERRWTKHGSTLTVKASDGQKVNRPQELLDALLSRYALDPVAFLGQRSQDQIDELLAVCGVEPPVDQVRQILGEAVAPLSGESADRYLARLSADDTGLVYIRRREAGRVVEQKEKALREGDERLSIIGGRLKEDEKPQAATDIIDQIGELNRRADELTAAKNSVWAATKERDEVDRRIAAESEAMRAAIREGDRIAEEIERLKAEREKVNKAAVTANDKVKALQERRKEADAIAQEATIRLGSIVDPAPVIAAAQQQLATVEQRNKAIAQRQHQTNEVDRLALDHQQAKDAHGAIDKQLELLRRLRRSILEDVDLGVRGLSVDEGELKLNGVSFRQASGAERLRVACAVAMKQKPQLRLLRVDDGEHLDGAGRRMLFDLAEQNDFQVVMTCVSDQADLHVEIADSE